MFSLKETALSGCFEITPRVLHDQRGSFIKIFNRPEFDKLGIDSDFQEEYYSVSHHGVIRGLHFQKPNMEHSKLIYCVNGSVFDVVVDLRIGSPTYGNHYHIELSAQKANCLYIPKGFAHGFQALTDQVIMIYKTTSIYSPEHDEGILWSSVNVNWPITSKIISERDQNFIKFDRFKSPFNI